MRSVFGVRTVRWVVCRSFFFRSSRCDVMVASTVPCANASAVCMCVCLGRSFVSGSIQHQLCHFIYSCFTWAVTSLTVASPSNTFNSISRASLLFIVRILLRATIRADTFQNDFEPLARQTTKRECLRGNFWNDGEQYEMVVR